MGIGNVTWRKAGYSGDNGGGGVEVCMWRKSSYSGGNGGDCVEVASTGKSFVAVRDSKDLNGPRLAVTPPAWESFIHQVRSRTMGTN